MSITDHQAASKTMLKRLRIMAQYVLEQQNHDFKIDFEDYWEENFSGKAPAREFLEFWATDGLENKWLLWMARK